MDAEADQVMARLTALEHEIETAFHGTVTVTRKSARWSSAVIVTDVQPAQPDRCGAWWWVDEDEIHCGVGQFSSWELRCDLEAVVLIEQLVGAAAQGAVTEHTGMNDVVVRIRTNDGRKLRCLEVGKGDLFRLPWNRKRRYLPWEPSADSAKGTAGGGPEGV